MTTAVQERGPDRALPVSPPALRLRRPGPRDPRLLLGLVLVAASVALGSWAVREAGRTTPVVVAGQALVPGQPVTDVLEVRQVRLAEADELYLRPDEALDDLVAVRTVGAGELVPRSAVAAGADLALRPVAVVPEGPLPTAVRAGALVDLWHVPEPDDDGAAAGTPAAEPEPGAPRPLVEGVTVAQVSEDGGTLSVGDGSTVHVLVPVADLPAVLAALAGDGSVEVVHVPGGTAAP